MSDEAFDPFVQLSALPKGGVFIFRHYGEKDRRGLARTLRRAARRQRKLLLIARDSLLAYQLDADGVHYPEWQLNRARHVRRLRPGWLVSAAAHSLLALRRAAQAGADWAILSPIFIAKAGGAFGALGTCRLSAYARQLSLPVYALGGVSSPARIQRLGSAPIAGIAASSGFAFETI